MTDIVERLLSRPDDINPILKQDAAAEIVRLRTAVRMLGEIADACTFNDLNEICDYCRCGRASSRLSSDKCGGGA